MSVTEKQVGIDHRWNFSGGKNTSNVKETGLIPSFKHKSEIELVPLR